MLDGYVEIEGLVTPLMLLSGVLWTAVLGLGLAGYWFVALLLSVFLLHPWFIIGASHDGKISTKLLVFPLAVWTVLNLSAYILAEHYASIGADALEGALVTGFHPSFAAVYWLYWIGGFMTLVLAYGLFFRSEFLPEGKWDEFLAELDEIESEDNDDDQEVTA
ncbi:MAG: hypothetical protein ACQEQY_05350 [Halobacteriota archaeon]